MSLVTISRALNPFLGVRTRVEENMRVLTSIFKICVFPTLPQYSGFSVLPLRDTETFVITQCFTNDRVKLQYGAKKIWYNICHIKPYKSDTKVGDIDT